MKDPVGLGRSPTWVVLLLVGVSVTLIPMALTGPAVALPSIGHDLHADVGALQWVVNGYNLTFAAFMLATGALADRVGRRRVYRLGTGLFGLGALVCTLASSIGAILDTKREARGLVVNLADVLFTSGQAVLQPGARENLSKLSGILLAYPGPYTLAIGGHTDSVGSDALNDKLSQARAEYVRDRLRAAARGLDNHLLAKGVGSRENIVGTGRDDASDAIDRRVAFKVMECP